LSNDQVRIQTRSKTLNRDLRLVVVTGGAGFIGSNLVNALIDRGLRVRIVDNISTGSRDQIDPGPN
jgi:nucleoside-diphosphate-sugar epimerase